MFRSSWRPTGPSASNAALASDRMEASAIAAALADGTAAERECAYAAIESAVRGASAERGASVKKDEAVALAVACVKPLVVSVLCAPATKIAQPEYLRALVLIYEMGKLEALLVSAELFRKDAESVPLWFSTYTAPGTVFATMIARDEWTRDDAILTCAHNAHILPTWTVGGTAVVAAAGVTEMEFMGAWMAHCPYFAGTAGDRYVSLALLCLELVRSETDSLPEAVIAGAGQSCTWLPLGGVNGVGKALWEAGFLDVFIKQTLRRYNPMERIGVHNLIPQSAIIALRDVTEGAQNSGIEVITPLLDAGAVDIVISTLTAYQMLDSPEAASVASIQWGALYTLEILLRSSTSAVQLIVAKLRSAGVDSFRYLLDHPLVLWRDMGMETSIQATRIAAQIWGRDDDGGGGLAFKQQDMEKIVEAAGHRGQAANFRPMKEDHGKPILNLCVSDLNKELLLCCDGFLPLLVDSLLLDLEHPRQENTTPMGATDWEATKGPVQRDFAEAIAQLAMFPPGREALLHDPTVAEALQQVAAEGWLSEARQFAESALAALSDRQPDAAADQWNVQEVVRRVVNELQVRGYRTWFDLDDMKGSTVDSMSDAVDNAEVMLSCISLAYKESANCRLEAQYGHASGVDMIPLMMESGYKPTGWLGLILGTRVYFNFHPAAVETDGAFIQQVDAVARELGGRGHPNTASGGRVSEGVPPGMVSLEPSPAPAPAPAPPQTPAPAASAVVNRSGFTPSMQLSSPAPAIVQQRSTTDDASLVAVLLEREERMHAKADQMREEMEAKAEQLRQEAKAEKAELRQEMQQQMEAMREEMKPAEAIPEQRLAALQARLEALHAAKLLGDDELYALEDMVADFVEFEASLVGVVTLDAMSGNQNASKLLKLVALSERLAADGVFARQARRKYV